MEVSRAVRDLALFIISVRPKEIYIKSLNCVSFTSRILLSIIKVRHFTGDCNDEYRHHHHPAHLSGIRELRLLHAETVLERDEGLRLETLGSARYA